MPELILKRLQGLYAEHFGDVRSRGSGPASALKVFASAPGRFELAGNHTDHQGGHTISAAIDRRAYALAAANGSEEIRVFMEGFGKVSFLASDLEMRPEERGTSAALIRGMAAAFVRSGKELHGFNLVTCSDIPVGSGLSSSAAFEVLIGITIRALFDPEACMAASKPPTRVRKKTASSPSAAPLAKDAPPDKPTEAASPSEPEASMTPADLTALALAGAEVEREYFGKPCGAQDQLASAHGGVLALDFSAEVPRVSPLAFDADAFDYSLCLIDSRSDHSLYTPDFAAIPADMRAVAQRFGCSQLGNVAYPNFLTQLADLRAQLGDRAVLRALHYFEEDERVLAQQAALHAGDFVRFLELFRLSGASSAQFLQSLSPHADVLRAAQPATVILALCAHLLDGKDPAEEEPVAEAAPTRGAYRIHGGGFGGSILALVPRRRRESFMAAMNARLGYDACMPVSISAHGARATKVL